MSSLGSSESFGFVSQKRRINLPAAPSYPEVESDPSLGYGFCSDLESAAAKKTWKQSGLGGSMLVLTAVLAPLGTALSGKPHDFNPDDDDDATNDIGAIEQSIGPMLVLLAGASLGGAASNYFYKKSAATGQLIADAKEGKAEETGIKAYQACIDASAKFERERASQLTNVIGTKEEEDKTPEEDTASTPATAPVSLPSE